MTRELKQRWIDALRSGKYKQTTGTLRRGSCFCALGVLCDVKAPTLWRQFCNPEGPSDWCFAPGQTLGEVFGGDLPNLTARTQIIKLNDGEELPFSEIADWIETFVPTED